MCFSTMIPNLSYVFSPDPIAVRTRSWPRLKMRYNWR